MFHCVNHRQFERFRLRFLLQVAKKNYEKYGNPDGPGGMKIGVGLPRFLVEEGNQIFVLSFFFLFLLVVLPMIFLCYYQRQKKYARRLTLESWDSLPQVYLRLKISVAHAPAGSRLSDVAACAYNGECKPVKRPFSGDVVPPFTSGLPVSCAVYIETGRHRAAYCSLDTHMVCLSTFQLTASWSIRCNS